MIFVKRNLARKYGSTNIRLVKLHRGIVNEVNAMETNMSPHNLETNKLGDHGAKSWDKVGHGRICLISVNQRWSQWDHIAGIPGTKRRNVATFIYDR